MTHLRTGYFDYSPDLTLSYEVAMANPPLQDDQGLATYAGLHVVAFGYPENFLLEKISNSGFSQFLLRNSFDYLSYISQLANAVVACVIEDYF